MKIIFVILIVLLSQPVLAKPDVVIHQSPGFPVNFKLPGIPAYKPAKELSTPKPLPSTKKVETSHTGSLRAPKGNCDSWIREAGIKEIAVAKELIRRESNCNPNARNPSSGACNVAQELPCGKSGCRLGDGACSVKWMNRYVLNRYGSWSTALGHHDTHNWY